MHKIVGFLFIWNSLAFVQSGKENAQPEQQYFLPDSSIGRKIILFHPASVTEQVGDLMTAINREKALPDVYLASKDKSQYLRLVFLPGSEKNSFGFFEVGEMTELQRTATPRRTSLVGFSTESGIALGMSKDRLTAIKGKSHQVIRRGNAETLHYTISDPGNSFLRRYNMPLYRAEYRFVNDKLIRFAFGFEYP